MPPVITKEMLEQDETNIKPLDEDDIALLKTYVHLYQLKIAYLNYRDLDHIMQILSK